MMRRTLPFLLALLFVFLPVYADEVKEQMEIAGVGELNEASRAAESFDPHFNFEQRVEEELSGNSSSEDGTGILTKAIKLFIESLKDGISETSKIMLAVFVFGIILRFLPEGTASEASFFATYTVLFTMALFIFEKAAEKAAEVINEMNFFVKAAVPVMCTLSVPGGRLVSSAQTAGIIGGICVVTEWTARVLMPLSCMLAAMSAANNLSSDMTLKGLERLIKKVILWSVGITTTVFVTLIKIRGITGTSLDNITGKTIKFAVGNMVPIVGGIISDSLDNIISYSRAIQGSCGVVGIVALIYMILPPVLNIAGILVAFRLTGIITSPVADSRLTGAIEGFSDILGTVLLITVVVCILFITAMGSLAV